MLSFVCLPVFIILVYVSGSAINDIETTSATLFKEDGQTFIKATALATAITTPSVTTDLSSTSAAKPDSTPNGSNSTSEAAAATTPSIVIISKSLSTTTTAVEVDTTRRAPSSGYLNITSQAGTHAYLPCNVKQLVKKPLSWIRVRDGHILTVDQTTFIADQRFQSIYTQNPERWSLQIKYVQSRDAGSYECQVSTEPKMSARVSLNIVEPKTELLGEPNRHVKAGSRVILRCIVSEALEPPLFINWYFDKKQIYLHNHKGWRAEVDRETAASHNDRQNTIASLIIPSVSKKDSGNYTCSPSNSEPITVVLHVLNGEYSASAITSGCGDYRGSLAFLIILCLWTFTKI